MTDYHKAWIADTVAKLQALRGLKAGWYGDADAPSSTSISDAERLVSDFASPWSVEVVPAIVGGLYLRFSHLNRWVDVTFVNWRRGAGCSFSDSNKYESHSYGWNDFANVRHTVDSHLWGAK